jgi:hypothetical protein
VRNSDFGEYKCEPSNELGADHFKVVLARNQAANVTFYRFSSGLPKTTNEAQKSQARKSSKNGASKNCLSDNLLSLAIILLAYLSI